MNELLKPICNNVVILTSFAFLPSQSKVQIKILSVGGGGGGCILLKWKFHLPGDPPIGELLRDSETSKVKVKTSKIFNSSFVTFIINFFTFNVSVFSMFPGADLTESLQIFLRCPIVSWWISLWLASDLRESQESLENSFLHFITILWTLLISSWRKSLTWLILLHNWCECQT